MPKFKNENNGNGSQHQKRHFKTSSAIWIVAAALVILTGISNVHRFHSNLHWDGDNDEEGLEEIYRTVKTLKSRNTALEEEVNQLRKSLDEKSNGNTKTVETPAVPVPVAVVEKDVDVTNTNNNNNNTFVRHDNVVIVTKIHGSHQWFLAEQSLCLLHYAYNHRVLYDIIIFTAEPIPENDVKDLQTVLAPAKLTVVRDNKGLHEEISDLSSKKLEVFKQFCNITTTKELEELDWWSYCSGHRLNYNWQAEFRGKRIWHHPSISQYKTMFWIDTDGFPTKPWDGDPVDYFIKNDGVIMFQGFKGKAKPWIQERLVEGFNATICSLKVSEETGNVESAIRFGAENPCGNSIPDIHGFMHITNLDFYRSPAVTKGLEAIFGDCFLCREPDDQFAVTAPAAILAPERSFQMRGKGYRLDVFHNMHMDGFEKSKPSGFIKRWKQFGETEFPSAVGKCKIKAGNRR